MSTTENFKVCKDISTLVKARVWGKYDYSQSYTFTQENENLNIIMDEYDGVSFQRIKNYQSVDTLDFSNTVLPWKWEYNKYLKQKCYAFAPIGQDYNIYPMGYKYNFDIVGNLTIDNENKIVSGFSISNYIKKDMNALGNIWDVYIKFKTSSSTISGGQQIFEIGTTNNEYKYVMICLNMAGSGVYVKTSNDGTANVLDTATSPGAYSISNNTTYYLKVGCDGTNTYAYISTSGYSNMTLMGEVSTTTTVPADTFFIGYEPNFTAKGAFGGSIDLSETYIKVNGSYFWESPITQQVEQELNTTVIGSPTINSQFIASNFSTSNYLRLPAYFKPQTDNWIVELKVKTPSTINKRNLLIGGLNNFYNCGFAIELNSSGKFGAGVSSNGSSWNIGWISGTTTVKPDTTYWIQLSFTGTDYILQLSTNGADFVIEGTKTNSNVIYTSNNYLQIGDTASNTDFWQGSIYLEDSYIMINGVEWWRGTKDVVEILPGCLYNYNDEQTVQSFVINGDESIVLSPDSYYDPGYWLQTLTL